MIYMFSNQKKELSWYFEFNDHIKKVKHTNLKINSAIEHSCFSY